MKSIETMRKELETAKKIRENGYTCQGLSPYISCYGDKCPSLGIPCLFSGKPAEWDALHRALTALDDDRSADLLSEDIRQVIHHLGTITGEITNDDILSQIFSKFCIGK